MQRRICAAAVSRLAAQGYHRTSIAQVVKAAGVSPGALQHHFPAKDDLVAAVAAYLLGRSVKWFERVKADLARDGEAFAEVIRRSWREQFRTDDYAALLEILTAARTDEALRARVAPALEQWRDDIEAALGEILTPFTRDTEELTALLTISRCLMTGLLVHDGLMRDEARMEIVLDKWTDMVGGKS